MFGVAVELSKRCDQQTFVHWSMHFSVKLTSFQPCLNRTFFVSFALEPLITFSILSEIAYLTKTPKFIKPTNNISYLNSTSTSITRQQITWMLLKLENANLTKELKIPWGHRKAFFSTSYLAWDAKTWKQSVLKADHVIFYAFQFPLIVSLYPIHLPCYVYYLPYNLVMITMMCKLHMFHWIHLRQYDIHHSLPLRSQTPQCSTWLDNIQKNHRSTSFPYILF